MRPDSLTRSPVTAYRLLYIAVNSPLTASFRSSKVHAHWNGPTSNIRPAIQSVLLRPSATLPACACCYRLHHLFVPCCLASRERSLFLGLWCAEPEFLQLISTEATDRKTRELPLIPLMSADQKEETLQRGTAALHFWLSA